MGKRRKASTKQDSPLTDGMCDRFDASKPQFRKSNPIHSKTTLDERFVSALSDPRFQLELKDKHGKKIRNKSENLSSFYHDVERTLNKNDSKQNVENGKEKKKRLRIDDINNSNDDTDESMPKMKEKEIIQTVDDDDPQQRMNYLRALSRGELNMSSSSEEDTVSDSDSASETYDVAHYKINEQSKVGILDPSSKEDEDVDLTTEASPYLAVQNLEWTHIRAVDIFAIVASFVPSGTLKRVRVFQSDFGIERMEKEKIFGPIDLWNEENAQNLEGNHSTRNRASLDGNEGSDGVYSESETSMAGQSKEPKGFDPEKLRAYEASKLKYYFAVVELLNPKYADVAYKEIDGIEFEHSSAVVDVRTIPPGSIDSVVNGRPMRDEATSIPSNYNPPDFIVAALQKSTVECSWEAGDIEREKSLTKYTNRQSWDDIAEADDFKAYVGSDRSSDEEASDGENDKASRLRGMLGLDNDEENDHVNLDSKKELASGDDSVSSQDDQAKEISFIPVDVDKSKSDSTPTTKELTPWEKYLKKKKQKMKEKRKASRDRRKEVSMLREREKKLVDASSSNADAPPSQSLEELELLLVGDEVEEEERNFDMRSIQRIEKSRRKNHRTSRSQKSEKTETMVMESNFKIDISDERFQKVFDGSDGLFGIDRTDPNFKETTAMREILEEQSRRRKKQMGNESIRATIQPPETGLAAVSNLVKRLKSKNVTHR